MINVYNSTPKVYYDNSRDFQLFGRVYEVLFNYIQSNVSQVTEYEINNSLIDLLLYTLGFNKNAAYSSIDLEGLASIFKYVVKNKGTKLAIETCVYLLLRSQQIEEGFSLSIVNLDYPWKKNVPTEVDDLYKILLYLPAKSKDVIFLEDMFDYILPAGYIYQIYYTSFSEINLVETYGVMEDKQKYKGENTNDIFGGIKKFSAIENSNYTFDENQSINVGSMINSSVYGTPEEQVEETTEENEGA